MWKFIKQPSAPIAALLILTNLIQTSQTQNTCNNGQGRVLYERLPNQQLQGFDDDVIRDTAPPFRVLEKCQDLCLRDRTAQNNLVRACTSFDFQPGSRIASYNGNTEYEESTCYLTREQAVPEGIGNLMLVPNSVHFTEVCLTCKFTHFLSQTCKLILTLKNSKSTWKRMPKPSICVRKIPEKEAKTSSLRYERNNCRKPFRLWRQMFEWIFVRLSICKLWLYIEKLFIEQVHQANSSRAIGRRS